MIVLCSTVGRGYSLNKLFSENGRYSSRKWNGPQWYQMTGWFSALGTTVFRKNTHFCFLALLLEKVADLNENFRHNS